VSDEGHWWDPTVASTEEAQYRSSGMLERRRPFRFVARLGRACGVRRLVTFANRKAGDLRPPLSLPARASSERLLPKCRGEEEMTEVDRFTWR